MVREESEIDLTLSTIWREERVSCPNRTVLSKYVDGKLDVETADYLRFHIFDIGCPFCQASEEDLRMKAAAAPTEEAFRKRLFAKTSEYLKDRK